MSRVCQIILVCEGWRDSRFARSFLEAANVNPRKIEDRQNQGGSGHDWVKTEFVAAVDDLQKFSEGRGVLGLIDEDGDSHRMGQIAATLSKRGLPAINPAQGRCLLLPTRNLETWIYWLEGHRSGKGWILNEVDDYKRNGMAGISSKDTDGFCRSAGAHLHRMNHLNMPATCPPALVVALGQLRAFLKSL